MKEISNEGAEQSAPARRERGLSEAGSDRRRAQHRRQRHLRLPGRHAGRSAGRGSITGRSGPAHCSVLREASRGSEPARRTRWVTLESSLEIPPREPVVYIKFPVSLIEVVIGIVFLQLRKVVELIAALGRTNDSELPIRLLWVGLPVPILPRSFYFMGRASKVEEHPF